VSVSSTPSRADAPARVCPVCSAANHADRELCGACGVDLDTGARLPFAPMPSAPVGRAQALSGDRVTEFLHHLRDRALILVPAVVALAVLAVGTLATAQRGPFRPDEVLPGVPFPAAQHPDGPGPLEAAEVAATTSRPRDLGRDHSILALADGDATTAWMSDPAARSEDVTERIDVVLDEPSWVASILIHNGDQFDAASYERAGRVKRVVLVFDGSRRVVADLLDLGLQGQLIELPAPELTTRVEVHLVDLFPGAGIDGVAMSGIRLQGWVAGPDERALALARAGVDRTVTIGPLPSP
jgi:hypothetical protein